VACVATIIAKQLDTTIIILAFILLVSYDASYGQAAVSTIQQKHKYHQTPSSRATLSPVVQDMHTHIVNHVAFSPDGHILASGSYDKTIKLWKMPEGLLIRTLVGHTEEVYYVAFSSDGSLLFSKYFHNEIIVFNILDGSVVKKIDNVDDANKVIFDSDGKYIYSLGVGKDLKMRSLSEPSSSKILDTGVNHIIIGTDKRTFASIGYEINIWDISNGSSIMKIKIPPEIDLSVFSFACIHNKKFIVIGFKYGSIKVIRVSDGKVIRDLDKVGKLGGLSPDGKVLASIPFSVDLWNMTDGSFIRTLKSGHINSIAFSPDGTIMATVSNDIGIWNTLDGTLITTLKKSAESYLSVAFSPDGNFIASANKYQMNLWNTLKGFLNKPSEDIDDNYFIFNPDGKFLTYKQLKQNIMVKLVNNFSIKDELKEKILYSTTVVTDLKRRMLAYSDWNKVIIWNIVEWKNLVVSLNCRDEVLPAEYHTIRASQGTKVP